MTENQQSILTETYGDDNSKKRPTAGAFGPYFSCLLSTKSHVEQAVHQKGSHSGIRP